MKIRFYRFEKTPPRKITCARCNGFAGHFDGDVFHECEPCKGSGEVAAL